MASSNILHLSKDKLKLIEQIIFSLKNNYIFPDKILANESAIREALITGFQKKEISDEYENFLSGERNPNSPEQLVHGLSNILRNNIGDDHIHLWFDPNSISRNETTIRQHGTFPIPSKHNLLHLTPEEEKEFKDKFEQTEFLRNWGFSQSKVFANGIGYLKLDGLWPYPAGKPIEENEIKKVICNIMKKMNNSKTIILDLRDNMGGDPETVKYIASFFLPENTLINTIERREGGSYSSKEFRTLPTSDLVPENMKNEDFSVLQTIPIYILTSDRTFSAGEELAYDLQQYSKSQDRNRVLIVGQPSKGGAHATSACPLFTSQEMDHVADKKESLDQNIGDLNLNFVLSVPNQRSVNPYSKTNWEDDPSLQRKKGVQPDISTTGYQQTFQTAIEMARERIYDQSLPSKIPNHVRTEKRQWSPSFDSIKENSSTFEKPFDLDSNTGENDMKSEQDKLPRKKSD